MSTSTSTDAPPKAPAVPRPAVVKVAATGAHVAPVEDSAKTPGQHHYLLCLDPADTEASLLALAYTKERLALDGDLVVLLSVLPSTLLQPTSAYLGIDGAFDTPPDSFFEEEAKEHERLKTAALARLHNVAETFRKGVEVHIRIAYGNPVEAVIEAAQYHNVDMVITGRRKMGRLQRWLSSGSVSTAILTNSDLSVLVVR